MRDFLLALLVVTASTVVFAFYPWGVALAPNWAVGQEPSASACTAEIQARREKRVEHL